MSVDILEQYTGIHLCIIFPSSFSNISQFFLIVFFKKYLNKNLYFTTKYALREQEAKVRKLLSTKYLTLTLLTGDM